DRVGAVRDLHVAPRRAALLREAARVLRDDALAFEVRGHAEQLADRDHAGAADAGDDDPPGRFGDRQRRLRRHRDGGEARPLVGVLLRALQAAAFDRDEARAEALQARVVLVAGVLVDPAFAAELGLDRLDRQAVALHRAVAAAFADELVDDDALGRVLHRAALAAPALLGRARLVVDDDRAAGHLAQLPLHRIEVVTMAHRHAVGEARDDLA